MENVTIEHDPNQTEMFSDPDGNPAGNTAPAAVPIIPVIPINTRIEQYIRLRDTIKAEDEKHKDRMKPAREALEKLNGIMLNHLNTIGGDSVKTEFGTVYKKSVKTASLEDPDAFMRHVIGSESWELLDRKANSVAVEEFVKENGVLPPGVKFTVRQDVGVRRS